MGHVVRTFSRNNTADGRGYAGVAAPMSRVLDPSMAAAGSRQGFQNWRQAHMPTLPRDESFTGLSTHAFEGPARREASQDLTGFFMLTVQADIARSNLASHTLRPQAPG